MAVSFQFLKEIQPDAGFFMWSLVVALITAINLKIIFSSVTVGDSFLCHKELCNATPNCKSDKRGRSMDHQYIEIPDKTSSTKEEDKKHDGVDEMLTDFMQRRVLEAAYISRGGGKELRITKIFR
ncbi:hypothetical protein D5086_021575 [Populus alba]|uniref:Uncharacterized protein n=3 Tax=Populus TaxID=3689 RepID=A0A4U5Q2T6_POPAL|nr:hypothetical protein D5086_0000143600 [Populus alba]